MSSQSVNVYLAEVHVCPAAGWGQWRRAGPCTGPGCRAEPGRWRGSTSSQLQREQDSAQKHSQTHSHTESFFWDNLITSCSRKPDWPHWMSPQSYRSMTKYCSSQWKLHNTIFLTIKHWVSFAHPPVKLKELKIIWYKQSKITPNPQCEWFWATVQSTHCLAGSDKSACYARVTGFQPTLWINFQSSLCRYNTHSITSLSFSIHLPDLDTLTSTWPPLNGGDSGAVEDELLCRGVISGCRFQAPEMSSWKQANTLFWQEVSQKTETRTELGNGKWNSSSNA